MNQKPGCLFQILQTLGLTRLLPKPESDQIEMPYRLRDDYLSPAELSFYHVLENVVGEELVICPKVNLADIFYVVHPHEHPVARNQINRKHLDFLLCKRTSMRPIVGIELDDASHARAKRIERDIFVNALFAAAGLPLLRVPVQRGYNVDQLASRLSPYLLSPDEQPTYSNNPIPPVPTVTHTLQPAAGNSVTAPACPKCGVPMVLRIGRSQEKNGSRFYGCSNFPQCRQTLLARVESTENNGAIHKFQWPQR